MPKGEHNTYNCRKNEIRNLISYVRMSVLSTDYYVTAKYNVYIGGAIIMPEITLNFNTVVSSNFRQIFICSADVLLTSLSYI